MLESVLGAAERRGLAHPHVTGHRGTGVTLVGFSRENEDGAA